MNKRLIINDILLICSIIAVMVLLQVLLFNVAPSDSTTIRITYNNAYYADFSLAENYSGYIGDSGVHLTIQDGKAYIDNSDCSDRFCTKMKPIESGTSSSTSIVCLPNRVSVTKAKNSTEGVDIIAG